MSLSKDEESRLDMLAKEMEQLSMMIDETKHTLRKLRTELVNLKAYRNELVHNSSISKELHTNGTTMSIDVIGFLPHLLLSDKYFPSNAHLAQFAEKNLGVKLRFAGKRSRPEIIGMIITEVANLDKPKLSKLRAVLNRLDKKVRENKIEDLYLEWSKAISELHL